MQAAHPELPEKRVKLVALIEHLDYNIGRVLSALDASGQRENTLVIFASDNGGDRGSMANNGPTRGAKGDMYEGGIHVACAFNMPGRFEGGRRLDNFMMLMDIFPTLCDYLHIRAPKGIDGISCLKAIDGGRQNTENRYVFWMRYEGGKAFNNGRTPQTLVRYDGYKLMRNKPAEGLELFDFAHDPMEEHPLELSGRTFEKLDAAMRKHFLEYQKRYGLE